MKPPMPSRRNLVLAGASLSALVLAGCETPPADTLPDLTFSNARPLPLDVAELVVEDRSAAFTGDGNGGLVGDSADDALPEPVAAIVTRWANQRFFAIGQSGSARLIIEQASLRRELLARSQGLRGIVTIDQSERFSTGLTVRMALSDFNSRRDGFAWASVAGSTTVPENATLAQRQSLLFEMVEQAINRLDTTLVAEMREKVPAFVMR